MMNGRLFIQLRIPVALICFLLLSARASAQDEYLVKLRQEHITPPLNGAAALFAAGKASGHSADLLLQFHTLPGTETLKQLAAAGILLEEYIGGNAYRACLTGQNLPVPQALREALRSVVPFRGSWKTDPELSATPSGRVLVSIMLRKQAGTDALEEEIAKAEGTITDRSMLAHGIIQAEMPPHTISGLAEWHGIRYIGPGVSDLPLNMESAQSSKINLAQLPAAYGGRGLLGKGVTIGIGDNFSAVTHIDLKDRVTNFHPWPYGAHGVHISGIAAGAGIMDPRSRGMAPEASILSHVYSEVWAQTIAMKQGYHMTLTNNSYAARLGNCAYFGIYDSYSAALDNISRAEPDVLHVFAAGNDGEVACGIYAKGFGTVAGSYQAAKNVLVVGSNTKWYQIADLSSKGPVRDGRLKPEITAVGHEVFSTRGVDDYLTAGGTSMASPAVTGALALLSERYRQLHGNRDPRGDLLKNLILNGAMDIDNPGPDYTYGFGVLSLQHALEILEEKRYFENTIRRGNPVTEMISVPPGTAALKVMLYWHDTAASPASARTLVQDLDLKVITPSGGTMLPLVLDTFPDRIGLPAKPGVDRLNNAEQVVVQDPQPGTYTLVVDPAMLPYDRQDYVLSYNFLPYGIRICYPDTASAREAGSYMRAYWEASSDPENGFVLEFSLNNGAQWNLVSELPFYSRTFDWELPDTSSTSCRIRITRKNTGEQAVSPPFTISRQPALKLSETQCPGYMTMEWAAVPGASAYEVLWKQGEDLHPADTVSILHYTFSGLATDRTYYAAVRPLFANKPGWRSRAVKRKPDDGSCMGSVSDGDLMAEEWIAPHSGRMHTASSLESGEQLSFRIRNLDDAPVRDFRVHYRINEQPWETVDIQQHIPANTAAPVSFAQADMSLPGTYRITLAVENLTRPDPVSANDTLVRYIRQLENAPLDPDVPFTEDFEDEPALPEIHRDTTGLTQRSCWDFYPADSGRLRFFVSREVTPDGNRSASMDLITQADARSNFLDGTWNMSAFRTAVHEARAEFNYRLHGIPASPEGNGVWLRGSDQDSWIPCFAYNREEPAGALLASGSLSLTDILAANGQEFSSSFQLRFGQRDSGVIASGTYGNGLTLDNIRIYRTENDMQLLQVVSPGAALCAPGSVPVQVLVRNGHNKPQYDVPVYYMLDSGEVRQVVIPEIGPKDSLLVSFPEHADLSVPGARYLDAWIAAAGDSYSGNDSILRYRIMSLPQIHAYPYLEDFEQGDGYWYTEGIRSSWTHGIPGGEMIRRAASGTYAWKTGLRGGYNNSEHSYLYSPCFSLNGMHQPVLSFSAATDIEHCEDEPCDAVWLEYSADGGTWRKLTAPEAGTNWYNTSDSVWSVNGFTRWHVKSARLPRAGTLRLRFVMHSDVGVTGAGMAVDDIHIHEEGLPAPESEQLGASRSNLVPGTWENMETAERILAGINLPLPGRSLRVEGYAHTVFHHPVSRQYYLPQSYVLKSNAADGDTRSGVRFFISEKDFVTLLNDTACPTCSRPEDAYSLAITAYKDPEASRENGSLADNINGRYTLIPARDLRWLPRQNGYVTECTADIPSEFWFHGGGPQGIFTVQESPLSFRADKAGAAHARLEWHTRADTFVTAYILESAIDTGSFQTIHTIPARKQANHRYNYTDTPAVGQGSVLHYRIRYIMDNGSQYYSEPRQIAWTDADQLLSLYPNPASRGEFYIGWSSRIPGNLRMTVTDVSGKTVHSEYFPATGWNNLSRVSVPALSPGVYLVKAMISGNSYYRKLLIQ